jgi:hypothetical protein
VTWHLRNAAIAFGIVAVTSLILKFTWYDHMKTLEAINNYSDTVAKPAATTA